MNNQEKIKSPQWFIIKAVAAPIILGTVLLMLPLASQSGQWTPPLTALFMATSAMCVTGHTVVDPASYFSHFGQMVLLLLFQLGGLGFMTLATTCLVLLGRRLSIQSERTLTSALGREEANQLKRLLYRTIVFAFVAEGLGALILMSRLVIGHGFTAGRAFYHGAFHAISAFCNAGFALYADSLIALRGDKFFILTIAALIILGGLGYLVINECALFKFWRENRLTRGRLSLHTQITVMATLVLIMAGWLAFALLEWNATLAPLDVSDRLICALFQSVTPRTAGFAVVDMAQTHAATRFATMVLMFIGGSPGSAAGGIKTTTAVVLLFATLAMIRGKRETTLRGRTLSGQLVAMALTIFLLGLAVIGVLYGLLLVSEEKALLSAQFTAERLLFETISACATVGLTTGILPGISTIGKLLIILGMFIGRVGPLTMALVVGLQDTRQLVRFPQEDVNVG
ncbi:MAG: Trk family potassium uptake protein [Lentisphaerae bacterium]|nr:Trk family potassium uptake protein [Lentisphaerota bacterium]